MLDHYTGLDMIFLTELKGHKGIKEYTADTDFLKQI